MSKFRQEIVQTAAVAVAILEDLMYGTAFGLGPGARMDFQKTQTDQLIYSIVDERERQDKKWGPQHHNAHTWMAILAEEMGEAARELGDVPTKLVTESNRDLDDMVHYLMKAEKNARRYLKREYGQD